MLFGLAMAALPVAGEPRAVSESPITLYTKFQVAPPKDVPQAMEQELASIFSPVGLHFEWRSLADAGPGQVTAELVVVNFLGTCNTESPLRYSSRPGPLGWTHMTDHEVLPFTDVDCGRLSSFLRPVLAGYPPRQSELLLGRAMARVLAHELYHVFARTTHHGSSGVARNGHSVQELTAESFQFQEADLNVLTILRERNRYLDLSASLEEGRFLYAAGGCASCHGADAKGTARAPSLRPRALRLTLSRLASRLTGKPSEMQRRARGYASLWQAFGNVDIQSILTFLNTAAD